jgi:hypothetical protein
LTVATPRLRISGLPGAAKVPNEGIARALEAVRLDWIRKQMGPAHHLNTLAEGSEQAAEAKA